jgi:hypothetical protein
VNLQELPTSVLIAWDARIKSDLEVFVPTFIPQDGEPSRTWLRYRQDIRAELQRRGTADPVPQAELAADRDPQPGDLDSVDGRPSELHPGLIFGLID